MDGVVNSCQRRRFREKNGLSASAQEGAKCQGATGSVQWGSCMLLQVHFTLSFNDLF